MLKLIFEYLTSPYSLVENPLHDWILLGVIGAIAFAISFRIVGWMYDEYFIKGRGAGSFFHWTIRFIVFVILHFVVAFAIKFYVWIMSIPAYIWWSVLGIVAGGICFLVAWYHSGKKRAVVKLKDK